MTDELQREVESVIFQHLKPEDQMECDDFAQLRERRGAELFDLRKTGTFRYDEIEAIARAEHAKAWAACDTERIKSSLEKCVAKIKEADVLKTQLKTGFSPRDVAEWLFNVDHIDITHGIQYEGKDLRLLSPGAKGIVLLILYLTVDRIGTELC